MAFSHGMLARTWMGGFPSSGELKEFSAETKIETSEVSVFTDVSKEFVPSMEDGTVKIKGYFKTDSANPTLQFEYFLDAKKRVIFPATFMPAGGGTLGDPAYMLNGFLTDWTIDTNVKDAAAIDLKWQSNTGLQRGLVYAVNTARTATATGTQIDNGLLSSKGGAACLQVESVTGTSPTLDVVLEHSVDNSTYVTLGTFPQQTARNGVYLTFSGTVNRYVRARWTIGGTATPTFTFNVVVNRG